MALFVAALGIYLLIFSFRSANPRRPPRWILKTQNWLSDRIRFDEDTTKISVFLLTGGIGAICLVVLPMAFWVFAAYSEGKKESTLEICEAKTRKIFPSTIRLVDGTAISGKFLERSEKLSVLLNNVGIYVITVGEKPQLVDFTNIDKLNLKCPNKPDTPK